MLEAAPAASAVELLAPHLPAEQEGGSPWSAGTNPLAMAATGAGGVVGTLQQQPQKGMEDIDPELLAAVVRCLHTALRRLELGPSAVAAGGMTQQEAEAMATRLVAGVVPGLRCCLVSETEGQRREKWGVA